MRCGEGGAGGGGRKGGAAPVQGSAYPLARPLPNWSGRPAAHQPARPTAIIPLFWVPAPTTSSPPPTVPLCRARRDRVRAVPEGAARAAHDLPAHRDPARQACGGAAAPGKGWGFYYIYIYLFIFVFWGVEGGAARMPRAAGAPRTHPPTPPCPSPGRRSVAPRWRLTSSNRGRGRRRWRACCRQAGLPSSQFGPPTSRRRWFALPYKPRCGVL